MTTARAFAGVRVLTGTGTAAELTAAGATAVLRSVAGLSPLLSRVANAR